MKFNKGDKVKVISNSAWKGKTGEIANVINCNHYQHPAAHSHIENTYRVLGLELFGIAFSETELEKIDLRA